jgi:hypothetical protein
MAKPQRRMDRIRSFAGVCVLPPRSFVRVSRMMGSNSMCLCCNESPFNMTGMTGVKTKTEGGLIIRPFIQPHYNQV